ncbi:T9SS type A sorting domain-containing protein [Nonlabens ponticola]|uniref:T9SS type A sorting domain-containing protein n=1 Tax=Nonlabens ponticola TaxID=2496866 RepID=A0A3S9MZV5_9FLAO|nr:T9SS type A sorting domain-containing protein [Nonlabens ponticola]AZQ44795.1 T9SS type A sorting domain-containing protein [Nonlabens ponticola]
MRILYFIIILTTTGALGQTRQELLDAAAAFPPMPRETIDMIPFAGRSLSFGSGTPFNDLEYTIMNFDYIDGENGGSDTFMPVRPSEKFPGSNSVKYARSVLNTDLNEAYDTGNRDRFILGTSAYDLPFFSSGSDNIDNDYMVIQHFDYEFGAIELNGKPLDYKLLKATESEGVNTSGNYLFHTANFNATGEVDLIAFIFPCDDLQDNVSGSSPQDYSTLCNQSQTLDLDNRNQFVFSTPIETTPSIPQAIAQYGGPGKEVIGGMTADSDGNVYLMGATDSDLTGDGNIDNEIFISKIDPSGESIWVYSLPQKNGALLFDAVTDEEYIYVCGRTLDAIPGYSNAGRWDGVLLKIDINTGILVASNQWGNSGIDGYGNIVLDENGGLYVSGQGSPNNGDGGTDNAYLVARHKTSDLSNDWRVIEPTTATGFSASAEAWGGLYFKKGATQSEDRIVVAGWYIAAGGANNFVSVYDNLYAETPTRPHSIVFSSPGSQADWVMDNVIDSEGNIYIAGYTSGNLQGGHQGQGDAYVRKYSPSLTNPQTLQFGTPQSDMVRKMEIDGEDNIYLVGHTYGNLFASNADISLNTGDVYAYKLDSDLNVLASVQLGTPHEDRAFSAFKNNLLFMGGMTEGVIKDSSKGSFDGYVLALDPTNLELSGTTLSTNEETLNSGLRLYPNPVIQQLRIQGNIRNASLKIYDLTGRLMMSQDNFNGSLDVSNIKTGNYIIALKNDNQSKTFKVIKL